MSETSDQIFETSFMLTISKICQRYVYTCREAFELWKKLQERQKNGLWDEVGRQCGLTSKQAHDRWHNRFSRQFYDDITLYKPQIKELINRYAGTKNATAIIEEFYRLYPTVQLHPQTMFQHVTYQLRVHGAKQQKTLQVHSTVSSTMSKDTMEQISTCEKTDRILSANDIRRLEYLMEGIQGGCSDDEE